MLRTLAFLGIAAVAGRALLKQGRFADDLPVGKEPVRHVRGAGASTGGPGHVPTDLAGDDHPDGSARADDHFRPDPHASVAPEDRESLRPVTMKSATGPQNV